MMTWVMLHPGMMPEHLGLLPDMLDENDPRPAKEQFNENYGHGGGWRPFQGHTMLSNGSLLYPGDPPMRPLAQLQFRDELIVFYEAEWVAIIQKDGSYEVCRMD